MRRTRSQRALTALIGLWLTTTVTGLTLPACPEHGGGMLGRAGPSAAPHHGASPASPAAHRGSAPGTGHEHEPHQCGCPGTCCVTGAVSAPSGRLLAIPVVPIEVAVVAAPVDHPSIPRAAPDVALPPPVGPPALRA